MRHINKLSKQLVWLVGFIFVILFIILGLVLPKMLIPVAENNIYNYLREPLQLVNGNVDYKLLDTEIAYIYVVGDSVLTTKNLQDELGIDNVSSLMKKITNEYGKIEYKHKYYYYYAIENERVKKIAITNDSYINKTKTEILDEVWGKDYFGSDRVVDDLVRRVRKKLPKLNVNSIYGYGYRLS